MLRRRRAFSELFRYVPQNGARQGPGSQSSGRGWFQTLSDHSENRRNAAELLLKGSFCTLRAGREHKFVEVQPSISDEQEHFLNVRPIEETPADILSFGENVSRENIRFLCQQNVPGWSEVIGDNIIIDQLCEGLSNQNFKVYLSDEMKRKPGVIPCVLFRVYGKDAGSLYDLEGELEIVLQLAKYQIGPCIYGNGRGWRIEEWHFSNPLPNRRMKNPAIFTQIAAQIARLHKLSSRTDFPKMWIEQPAVSGCRIKTWAEGAQKAAASFTHPESLRQMEALNLDEIIAENDWIKEFVLDDNPKIHGAGLDVVFSHWDCQENNVLLTHYGLRFIDFEYSGMEYQAFDIATYFVECTIDYLVDKHPFFRVSLADFPTESEQKLFCSIYLSEYLDTYVRPDDIAVSVLMERVQRFVLLVHYLWSLWGVIRAPQAPTYNNFDYIQFSQHRWFMYKWAKRALLHSGKLGNSMSEPF
jgi:thiamine kinase-like enzyme